MEGGARQITKGKMSGFPQSEVIIFPPKGICSSQEKWLLWYGGWPTTRKPAAVPPGLFSLLPTPDSPPAT